MKIKIVAPLLGLAVILFSCSRVTAAVNDPARQGLTKLLLGKEVKPLIDLPATKEGVNIYFVPPNGKQADERGVDLKALTKYLKSKGVGAPANEPDIITDVRFDHDRVEVQIGGGGEGRRGSRRAARANAGFPRAGGSRINFRYDRPLTDADLQPNRFLDFMSRILDVSAIKQEIAEQEMPLEFKSAIQEKVVKVGMTYQMALMAVGDPGQKKINDSTTDLSETWYYLINGRRWVVDFLNGKVVKVRVY
ncbi:MAG: hypothetical protein ACRD2P_15860 [Terriglobia bacterium]